MKTKASDNRMAGLKAYMEQRSQEIISKVTGAIEHLNDNGELITFEAVAKAAGVSRGTLYNNPQIKEQILKLRVRDKADTLNVAVPIKETKMQLLEKQVAALREKISQLETDKKNLIIQLVNFEEIKEENARLKNMLHGRKL